MTTQLRRAEREYETRAALSRILPNLPFPAPTAVIIDKVCREMNTSERDTISRTLLAIAPTHPHATHNGRVTMRFGREMKGWLWHSTPQTAAPISEAEKARISQTYAPDEWTTGPTLVKCPDCPPHVNWEPRDLCSDSKCPEHTSDTI